MGVEGGKEEAARGGESKKESEESAVVGKQINSSVGPSRVFSGEIPNICFGRWSLIRARGCIYIGSRESSSIGNLDFAYRSYGPVQLSQQPTPFVVNIVARSNATPPFPLLSPPSTLHLIPSLTSRSHCQE